MNQLFCWARVPTLGEDAITKLSILGGSGFNTPVNITNRVYNGLAYFVVAPNFTSDGKYTARIVNQGSALSLKLPVTWVNNTRSFLFAVGMNAHYLHETSSRRRVPRGGQEG